MRYTSQHNTSATKQWTKKQPCMAKFVFRIVQNYGEKGYFNRF